MNVGKTIKSLKALNVAGFVEKTSEARPKHSSEESFQRSDVVNSGAGKLQSAMPAGEDRLTIMDPTQRLFKAPLLFPLISPSSAFSFLINTLISSLYLLASKRHFSNQQQLYAGMPAGQASLCIRKRR